LAVAALALSDGCAYKSMGPKTATSAAMPAASESASTWQKFKSSVSSGSKKMTDAVTPKPQIVKANDPTSLSVPTAKIGPDLYVAAARIHESKGDVPGATVQYERALQTDGSDLAALVGYGHLLDRQKKYTEATLYYERATKAHPDSAAAWNDLGLCYSRRAVNDPSMMEKSVAALRKAVDLKPDKKLYRNNIAAVLVETNRENEAFAHLIAVHDPATAHYNLGYLLNQHGDTAASTQHFAEALRLNPQMTAAQSYLAQAGQRPNSVADNHPPQYAPRSLFVPTSSRREAIEEQTPHAAPIPTTSAPAGNERASYQAPAGKPATGNSVHVASAELPAKPKRVEKPHTPEHIPAPLPKARTAESTTSGEAASVEPIKVGQPVEPEVILDAPEPPALLLGVEAAPMPAAEQEIVDAPAPQ
jgi:tetratricopeptide (TPR) repeat protein